MGNKNCEACNCLSKTIPGESSDTVYTKNAIAIRITLCRIHSIELFKLGQNSFLTKYSEISLNRSSHKLQSTEEAIQEG